MSWGKDSMDADDAFRDVVDPDAWEDRRRDEQHDDARREAHEREVRMRHVAAEVLAEAESSIVKHGLQEHVVLGTGSHTMPLARIDASAGTSVARRLARRATAATDAAAERGDVTWVAILLEEVFEAIAEDDPFALRAELVQVGAVVVKMIDRVDADRERAAHLARDEQRSIVPLVGYGVGQAFERGVEHERAMGRVAAAAGRELGSSEGSERG